MKEAAKVLGALAMSGVLLAVGAYVVLQPYLGGA